MSRFLVYDVFTDTRFRGNPLAVFPDATGLPEGDLQSIARELNFSETTFVYPPDSAEHTARVRIFTPTMEVPFAGHPTVGTAVALKHEGAPEDMVLELGVGPIPVSVKDARARFVTRHPLERIAEVAARDVAACLGVDQTDVTGTPVQASAGLPFVFAEVASLDTLGAVQPKTDEFRRCAALYPSGFDFAIYAYVRDGASIRARMFAPLDNIPEDPATGSAAAALSALLAETGGSDSRFGIVQGVEMGRASHIETEVTLGGDGRASAIAVSGRAVRVIEGCLT